jgi:chemotaxis signal transduction protein
MNMLNEIKKDFKTGIIFFVKENVGMINIHNIVEMLQAPTDFTNIMTENPYIEGMMTLRDEGIPIINLNKIIYKDKYERKGSEVIIVIKNQEDSKTSTDTDKIGIIVESVTQVAEIEDVEEATAYSTAFNPFFTSVFYMPVEENGETNKKLVFQLNTDTFFKIIKDQNFNKLESFSFNNKDS